MIKIIDKSQCCGCTACANICPREAILMEPDDLGFMYPKIEFDKCIDCGLCDKVCSFNDNYDKSLNLDEPDIYAARNKNIREIETSRSGAAFIAISDRVLELSGVVYGVGYLDHFRVVHKRATTKKERDEFKGSKYVQSDLGNIYSQVKQDLMDGLIVLFSGTPCQTSGLASFIGHKLRKNLILVDIVCHGVPSPYIWRDYISYLEEKNKNKIVQVDFRDKSRVGWSGYIESFVFSNGKKLESVLYRNLFFKDIMIRKSCSVCHFTNYNRPSDFTIGDFWGWQRASKDFNIDNKGCSLLLVNSSKGRSFFRDVSERLNLIKTNRLYCTQPNLIKPTGLSKYADEFASDYKKYGFIMIIKKYGKTSFKSNLYNLIMRCVYIYKQIVE